MSAGGCAKESAQPDAPGAAPVEITVAVNAAAAEMEGLQKMLDAAKPQLDGQNITASIMQIPTDGWVPFYQKLMALQAAGTAPDVARIAEFYLPVMIAKNQVADLTDKVARLNMDDYFESAFRGASHVDGRTYGVPSGMYSTVMYFNKDLFDQAGLAYPSQDWENPNTLQEVAEMAAKLTAGSGADKVTGFGTNITTLHLQEYLLGNGGSGLYDAQGKCALMEPLNLEVYQIFGKMAVENQSMLNTNDTKVIGAADLFREGKLAMYVDGTWNQNAFKSIAKFTPGMGPVPAKPGKSVSISFLDQWIVPAGSKQQDAAWETIRALIGEEAVTVQCEYSLYGGPILRSVMESLQADYMGEAFDDTDLAMFMGSLDHLVQAPYTPAYNEYTKKHQAEVSELTLGTHSVEESVRKMVEIIDTANAMEY